MNYGYIKNYEQNINNAQGNRQEKDSQVVADRMQNAKALSGIPAGSVITGEIAYIRGNMVKLQLLNKQLVTARLEADIKLSVGQSLAFEIKQNSGQQIALKPLFGNTAINPAAIRALGQANILVNKDTLSLATTMMDEGMPIDKNSLQGMFRTLNAHPDANPADVVAMTKQGIPINDASLSQFAVYRNNEHQIINTVDELTTHISEVIDNKLSYDDIIKIVDTFNEPVTDAEVKNLSKGMENLAREYKLISDEGEEGKSDAAADISSEKTSAPRSILDIAADIKKEKEPTAPDKAADDAGRTNAPAEIKAEQDGKAGVQNDSPIKNSIWERAVLDEFKGLKDYLPIEKAKPVSSVPNAAKALDILSDVKQNIATKLSDFVSAPDIKTAFSFDKLTKNIADGALSFTEKLSKPANPQESVNPANTDNNYQVNRDLKDAEFPDSNSLIKTEFPDENGSSANQVRNALSEDINAVKSEYIQNDNNAAHNDIKNDYTPGTDVIIKSEDSISRLLTTPERKMLSDFLKGFGVSGQEIEDINNGTIKPQRALSLIRSVKDIASRENLDRLELPEKVVRGIETEIEAFTKSEPFKKLLKDAIVKKITFDASEGIDKEKVNVVYDRLLKGAESIKQVLEQAGIKDTPLNNSLDNIRQNVSFMNQLNENFTYMQLPLQLSGENGHGDLYVYTNKKKLSEGDGNITALLHLELDTLGTMDIHVSLKEGNKVNTNFMLEREDMLDFIADNLHLLNERLSKRGFTATVNASLKSKKEQEEGNTAINSMLGQAAPKEHMLAKYSFDVKA